MPIRQASMEVEMPRAGPPFVATSPLQAISLMLGLQLLLLCAPAVAACDNTAPNSGQTVTCDTSSPNPATTPIAAVPGSSNVTVNVLPNAELDVAGNNGILVRDQSTVVNQGALRISGDTFDGISAQGSGAGRNVLINRGLIVTTGALMEGMFNSAAAGTMLNDASGVIQTSGSNAAAMHDFASPGGGSLTNNGNLSTSGDGSAGMAVQTNNDMIVNNGTITTTGTGSHGLLTNGAAGGNGNNVLTNHGVIDVSGSNSHGIVSLDRLPGVVTNTGSITSRGPGGLGAFIVGRVTLDNVAGASIVSQQDNGIDANGGGTLNNAGTITGHNIALSLVGGATAINNSGALQGGIAAAIVANDASDIVINNTGSIGGGNGQAILTNDGNDAFSWRGGLVTGSVRLGAGTDAATLTALTDTNFAGVPSFDGGPGTDTLTFNGTQASGVSRFINWETVNITNASLLTLDSHGLTLGDSGTLTGTLNIDSTSILAAGGIGSPPVMPAVAGQLVTVNNAGTIDLTNGGTSTSDALVVNGNYVGRNGRLLLQSVLVADGSPSDKLVIAQGTGSGNTSIGISNVGGSGGLTVTDGILVVQATSGASTAAGAFTLSTALSAGAYTYYLFKGGVSGGTANNWYLRSSVPPAPAPAPAPISMPVAAPGTPPLPAPPPPGADPTPLYRMEVPVYAEVPTMARQIGIEQIGTFHDRQGRQSLLSENGTLPAAWARAWGGHSKQSQEGMVDPSFDGTLVGLQIGHDIYADTFASGHRNHYGAFIGFARASGDISGFALGFPALAVGALAINAYSLSGYWTHIGPSGWYTDVVVQGSTLTIDPRLQPRHRRHHARQCLLDLGRGRPALAAGRQPDARAASAVDLAACVDRRPAGRDIECLVPKRKRLARAGGDTAGE